MFFEKKKKGFTCVYFQLVINLLDKVYLAYGNHMSV